MQLGVWGISSRKFDFLFRVHWILKIHFNSQNSSQEIRVRSLSRVSPFPCSILIPYLTYLLIWRPLKPHFLFTHIVRINISITLNPSVEGKSSKRATQVWAIGDNIQKAITNIYFPIPNVTVAPMFWKWEVKKIKLSIFDTKISRKTSSKMANQNEKILMGLLSLEENDKCCDCGSRGSLSDIFMLWCFIALHKNDFNWSKLFSIYYHNSIKIVHKNQIQTKQFSIKWWNWITLMMTFFASNCVPLNKSYYVFRRRICFIQPRDIFMWRMLADSQKSRNAHLKNKALIIGLLGGFSDQAVDGHWEPKGEVRVRKKDSSLLQIAEPRWLSPPNIIGAIHKG